MKFKNYLQVIVIAIFTFQQIHGASILFYWPFATYSHRISVWALVERLVDEGHNVTFLASHPPKSPNPKVTEVSSASGYAAMNFPDFVSLRFAGGVEAVDNSWRYYVDWGITLCDALLHDPKIIEWIHTSSFDLVVINGLFNDCGYGLAHKFKAPYIMYGTTAPFGWWSEAYGYPDENYPEMQFHYPEDMTFLQRVSNALRPLYWKFLRQYYLFPRLEAIFRETLNLTDAPSIEQMERNVSLIFVNTHVAEEFPRALPPSVIPIGGMHCKESVKPLPSDLLEFVNSGSEGFIYFSFGTLINPGSLPHLYKDYIFNAMKTFPNLRFIVKWQDNVSEQLPENVKIIKWAPQQDIFAHDKIRAFVSHGGLLGTQEAVYHGVPTIVMPLFAEQDYNAERIQSRGRGIRLEISQLTQAKFENAIREITSNETYKINTIRVSKKFRDRPQKPVDTAFWWMEYVLRHGDTSHLHTYGIKKTWYQRRMLDVWGFIALVTFAGLYTAYLFLKIIARYFSSATNNNKISSKSPGVWKKNS